MNVMKDFYLKHHPELEPAFKWRVKSIPPTDKPNSIANLTALEVALLGGLTTGAAAYFLLLWLGNVNVAGFAVIIVAAALGAMGLWAYYKHLLVDDR